MGPKFVPHAISIQHLRARPRNTIPLRKASQGTASRELEKNCRAAREQSDYEIVGGGRHIAKFMPYILVTKAYDLFFSP